MRRLAAVLSLIVVLAALIIRSVTAVESPDVMDILKQANQLMQDNNFADASQKYRRILSDPQAESSQVVEAIGNLMICQQRLGMQSEIDNDLAIALESHPEDYQVLDAAASQILRADHYGVVANQQFTRGSNRGFRRSGPGEVAGTTVNVLEQDRLQALKWRRQAIELAARLDPDTVGSDLARMHLSLAETLLIGRSNMQAWALQSLTKLELVPDYLNLAAPAYMPARYAPVDANNEPVLYALPESWEAANTDGERLRWALTQAEDSPQHRPRAKSQWAEFLYSQFSVETLRQDRWLFRSSAPDAEEMEIQYGIMAIHTLGTSETTARLASGVQRFSLADEFNFIHIHEQIAESDIAELNQRSAWKLVQTFLNRRQYPKAAERLAAYLERFSDDSSQSKQKLLNNIREARLRFDPVRSQLAGRPATLSLVFRNAEKIKFSARQVDLEKLLRDTKEFYRRFDPRNPNPGFGGKKNQSPPDLSSPASLFDAAQLNTYLLEQITTWEQTVELRPNHWDRRVEVQTPLTQPGLFLVEAEAGDGKHKTRCLVRIDDTVLIKKPVEGKWLLQVADSETGQPISGANMEVFGFGFDRQANRPQPRPITENFSVRSDDQGQAQVALKDGLQWFCVARTSSGRLALLGFEHVWQHSFSRESYGALKAYGVSDRPLYRPGETIKAKFWLGYASYGDLEGPRASNVEVIVSLTDPQGIQFAERQLKTDDYGGCDLEIDLDSSASLGHYQFQVRLAGTPEPRRPGLRGGVRPGTIVDNNPWAQTSLAVRVEEYRKPEFEVKILAPDKPVALGETIQARIEAKYYFGAPVTDAEVTVKVTRTTFRENYYPIAPFDWCYGPGYWWFAEDYTWYPGWARWRGCIAPIPNWNIGWSNEPPELVLEQEVQLDATGLAKIDIDTSLAKSLYGNENHKYSLSVEVRDASRRTISAQGSVIAALEPFKIYSWTHRGFYNVGDRIETNFHAQMLDGSPVAASGEVDLLRITYDHNLQPQEEVVASFNAATDDQGRSTQVFSAERGGQYRVRMRLRDAAGHEVEGAYIFTVRGQGADGRDFQYNALELTPDKQHYAPGETVKLQISANRANARVAVFLRPAGSVYQPPMWIELTDKSSILEIPLTEADQPNFFVEAHTIYDGKFHQQVREIAVPPAERVLNVEISADKGEYLPGEEAHVELRVTDPEGKPVAGSSVIAAYDRSLDQIGSDVLPQDIREFFWKWRRHHAPQRSVNIEVVQLVIEIQGMPRLTPLGIFGASLADDLDAINDEQAAFRFGSASIRGMQRSFLGRGRGGLGGEMMAEGMAMAPAAATRLEKQVGSDALAEPAAGPQDGKPQIRKDFADSALWLANVTTDSQGRGRATFKMPENLTSWKIRTWSVASNTRVGSASTEAVTRKPLLVRLQTPRFLVERDEVTISAIVHNDLPGPRSVKVSLEIDGETQFELLNVLDREQTIDIASHRQARVDWRCRATAEGRISLRAIAITDDAADAMQLDLPIAVNGILKTDALAGTVRAGQASSVVTIRIPEERRVAQSKLTIRLSPSLAAAMIDALPYLAEYPYGCTEQTLNRFLPTVITQQVLKRLQIDMAAIKQTRSNLNAQELGDPDFRRERWKRFDHSAVFDEGIVADMVQAGLARLTEMQNGDGGWGWFSGIYEHSGAHMTAVVVRGLLVAQANEAPIVPDVLERGLAWLEQYQQAELQKLQNADDQVKPFKRNPDNVDALVFHVLTVADRHQPAMQQILYDQRQHLSTYGKALLAWATHKLGSSDQTAMLRRNIEQFLVEDAENETAYLRDETAWWYWYGSEVEANAIYLKLLAAVEPSGPVAPRVVKYLLNNRKHATYWSSTRDTALVVEAFADYIVASGELKSSMQVEVYLSGKRLGTIDFTPQNLFEVNNTIEIQGNAVPVGEHSLEIRRSGGGNLYWNAYATNFTLEEEILPAGLEVKIERRYYHLTSAIKELTLPGSRANVIDAKQFAFERVLVEDLQSVPSGELIEVELLIESKNDYEYLVIEDYKPAGLEAVETQSGYFFDAGLSIYREFREKYVGLCIRWLPRGRYSIRYQFRSEAPGTFTALPAVIQGMYAPELRGNSADFDLSIID